MPHFVTITTPDGKDRQIRFTPGVATRIKRAFDKPWSDAMNGLGIDDIPLALFQFLHGSDGLPPSDMTLLYLTEESTPTQAHSYLAAMIEAINEGAVKKKEMEELLAAAREKQAAAMNEIIGTISSKIGALPGKPSDSPEPPRVSATSEESTGI